MTQPGESDIDEATSEDELEFLDLDADAEVDGETFENATEAMRIHGGYGYTTEFPIERYYRDAPLMIIGEGTNKIQRLVIARGLLARYAIT